MKEVSELTDMDRALESAIIELLSRRATGKTICPSEAARLLDLGKATQPAEGPSESSPRTQSWVTQRWQGWSSPPEGTAENA